MDRKRAFGYVRVSEMRDEKWSPESQRQAITKEADNLKVPLVEVYEDLAINSAHMKKAGTWDKLMDTVEKGDVIITADFTRIGRSMIDTLQRIQGLDDKGCEIVSLEQRFDTQGVYAKPIIGFMAGLAEADNILRGMKISAAAREKIKAGQWTGGPLPFGYRYAERNGKCLTVDLDPERAKVVKQMFASRLAGNGFDFITRELHQRGITSGKGKRWSPVGVKRVLRNRAYIGEREFDGVVYPLNVPPSIDRETWEAVQAIDLREPSRGRKTYLLSKTLTCSLCGGPMVHCPQRGHSKPSYICTQRKVWGDCKGVGISEHIADAAVLEALFDHIEDGGYKEAVDAYEFQERQAPELKSLRSRLLAVDEKRTRLLHLYTENRIDMKKYDAEIEPLNAQAGELEREIEKAEAGIKLPPVWKGDIRKDWTVLTLDEQRHALRLFVETITVEAGGRGPGRVKIEWR